MKKFVLSAFDGEFMCFIHVLLNALDMHNRGYDVRIVIEGAATKLIPELTTEGNPMYALYGSAKEKKLIDGVCRACSYKMGTVKQAEAQGLKLLDDMSGHPGMANYKEHCNKSSLLKTRCFKAIDNYLYGNSYERPSLSALIPNPAQGR